MSRLAFVVASIFLGACFLIAAAWMASRSLNSATDAYTFIGVILVLAGLLMVATLQR